MVQWSNHSCTSVFAVRFIDLIAQNLVQHSLSSSRRYYLRQKQLTERLTFLAAAHGGVRYLEIAPPYDLCTVLQQQHKMKYLWCFTMLKCASTWLQSATVPAKISWHMQLQVLLLLLQLSAKMQRSAGKPLYMYKYYHSPGHCTHHFCQELFPFAFSQSCNHAKALL